MPWLPSLLDDDLQALRLTAALAATTTMLLLLLGTPVAWWLARTRSRLKGVVAAVVALPLVLPPTVIGFYLLLLLGPQGPVGQAMQALGLGLLPFTFWGLVVASVLHSMPFVVQPLHQAFEAIGALDKLDAFAGHHGPDFYGLPRNTGTVTLKREPWTLPSAVPFGEAQLKPLRGGETLNWKLIA